MDPEQSPPQSTPQTAFPLCHSLTGGFLPWLVRLSALQSFPALKAIAVESDHLTLRPDSGATGWTKWAIRPLPPPTDNTEYTMIRSLFLSKQKSALETKVVTKQNPCKAVIAKTTSQRFQTTTDSMEEKKMAKNIFLPTSEFGKPKSLLFQRSKVTLGSPAVISRVASTYFTKLWGLNPVRWVRGNQMGMERAGLHSSNVAPSFCPLALSSLLQVTSKTVTAELSAASFQMFSVEQQTVAWDK